MISGGDRAMMSPVTRISTPLSKHVEGVVGPRRRLAVARLQLDAGDQAEVADVDDVARALEANAGPPPSRPESSAARVRTALVLVDLEGREAGGRGHRMAGVGSRGTARWCPPRPRHR